MLADLLKNHLWFSLGFYSLIYCLNHSLSYYAEKLYHQGVDQHYHFEKLFVTEPNSLKKLCIFLPLLLFYLWLVWLYSYYLVVGMGIFYGWKVFEFIWGGLTLIGLSSLFLILNNLYVFRYAAQSRGMKGTIYQSHWFSLKFFAFRFVIFSFLYLLFFLISFEWVFAGGGLLGLVAAFRFWWQSRKESPEFEVKPEVKSLEIKSVE